MTEKKAVFIEFVLYSDSVHDMTNVHLLCINGVRGDATPMSLAENLAG